MFLEISQKALAAWFDSPGAGNFMKQEALKHVFPREIGKSFRNTYFEEHLRTAGSDYLETSQ